MAKSNIAKSIGLEGLVTERDLNEEIAKVAYDLYKQRGMVPGNDFDDWVKAESLVRDRYAKLKQEEIDVMSDVADKIATKRRATKQRKSL